MALNEIFGSFQESEIFGIWFYELRACEQVGEALASLVKRSERPNNRVATAAGGIDLAALLMKASSHATDPDKYELSTTRVQCRHIFTITKSSWVQFQIVGLIVSNSPWALSLKPI